MGKRERELVALLCLSSWFLVVWLLLESLCIFSIKYRYSDILLKKTTTINFIYNCLFYCNHTCYCVNMVSVTSASRYITSVSGYHPRYQRRSSMYIRGLIPRNFAKSVEAVLIASTEEF